MKILLINNDSDTWAELQQLVASLGHDVISIHHRDIADQNLRSFDLAILSGGFWYDDEIQLLTTYASELYFIRQAPIPILGICLGMQLMHVAFEKAVPLMDEPQNGYMPIQLTQDGQMLLDLPASLTVFKNHTRAIIEPSEEFIALGMSPRHVEIMKHRSKPLLGVQFHPEINKDGLDLTVMNKLIKVIIPASTET